MARWGTIRLSTLAKYNRWDVGFYLGNPELQKRLHNAENNLKQAQKRVDLAQQAIVDEEKRLQQMRKEGDIHDESNHHD